MSNSRFKSLFNGWEWLKDTSNSWNYSRMIGMICILVIQPAVLIYIYSRDTLSSIDNIWQWLIVCIPSVTSIALFFIDIIRDKNSLKVKIGDKEYGVSSEN